MRNETKEVDFKHCCFNELSVLHDWSAPLRETRAKTKLVDLTKIPYGNGNQANLGQWFQPIAAWRQRETAIRQFGAEQCTKPLPFPFVEWICVLYLCLMARLKRLTFAWVLVVAFAVLFIIHAETRSWAMRHVMTNANHHRPGSSCPTSIIKTHTQKKTLIHQSQVRLNWSHPYQNGVSKRHSNPGPNMNLKSSRPNKTVYTQ